MKEDFDVYLRRSLKHWAARQEPLEDGRKQLIQQIGWSEEIGGRNISDWVANTFHHKRVFSLEEQTWAITRPRPLLMLQATFRLVV